MHPIKMGAEGQRFICPYTILQKRFNFKPYRVLIQIFVNYADFYVNIVMSTHATFRCIPFINSDYFTRYSGIRPLFLTISWFCKCSFMFHRSGSMQEPNRAVWATSRFFTAFFFVFYDVPGSLQAALPLHIRRPRQGLSRLPPPFSTRKARHSGLSAPPALHWQQGRPPPLPRRRALPPKHRPYR